MRSAASFDLLGINGQDFRSQPLVKGQVRLQVLLERFGCPAVRPSETFVDGLALLRAAEEHDLEGVVEQAPRCPLSVRRMPGLAQGQDAGLARGE